MDGESLMAFIKEIEPMKSQTRTAWTASGRRESVAEHSWRLCVMAMAVAWQRPELDERRMLEMCLVHDLGEVYEGDVSAALGADAGKEPREAAAVARAAARLSDDLARHVTGLWREYEACATPEARMVKALDKAETIIQHNQGGNPPDFRYDFNLTYGAGYFTGDEDLRALRALLDQDTRQRMEKQPGQGHPPRVEREAGETPQSRLRP